MSSENGLPKGWVEASLAQVGVLFCGQSPSASDVNHEGRGTPYVTGPEQWDGSTLTVDKWTTNPKRQVPEGCIFITVKGAGVGTLFAGVPCAIGRDVYAYKPAKGLSRGFIEHSLRYNISQVLRHAKGDIPGLSRDHILSHITAFAPLNEQRRIVAKIEELFSDLDAGMAALERAKANLKRYRAAVLKAAVEGKLTAEWRTKNSKAEPASKLLERILVERRKKWEADQLAKFAAAGKEPPKNWKAKYVEPTPPDTTDLPGLPDGWCWTKLDQLLVYLRNGYFQSPAGAEEGTPILRINAVRPMRVDLTEVRFLDKINSDVTDYFVENGDLLFTRYNGSLDLLGVAGMVRDCTDKVLHPDKLIRVRLGADQPLPAFVEIASNVGASRRHMAGRARTTAGQTGISGPDVKEMPIPLPPIEEQQQIVIEAEQRLSVIAVAEQQIEANLLRAARLRQSILKRAFEGKLVPQDPNDDPATKLLDRIRAESPNVNGKPKALKRKRTKQEAK